jgi:hypothetical protein
MHNNSPITMMVFEHRIPFQHRLTDIHDCMVENPLGKGGSTDLAQLRGMAMADEQPVMAV